MKKQLVGLAAILWLAPYLASAEISVTGSLSGTAKVAKSGVVKHRHSLDCYTTGKGDGYDDYGSETVSFSGERSISGNGETAWASMVSNPFSVAARNTRLMSAVSSLPRGERINLRLQDDFAGSIGSFHSEKCRHTDGYVRVTNPTIAGKIVVKYRVPENTWAVRMTRSKAAGVFSVMNQKPVTNAFNSTSDDKRPSTVILWAQPGQTLDLEINVPEFVGGAQLGSLQLDFENVARPLSLDQIRSFLQSVQKKDFRKPFNAASSTEFLEMTMGMVQAGENATLYTKNFKLSDLKAMSDEFFFIANAVHNVTEGESLKVASAMAAFQIARAVLIDMSAYCQDVEVYMPFTGERQQVLGLKAASFWLSRSMNYIKTYSYEPAEVFLQELQQLQEGGLTPAKIAKDPKLRTKVQNGYKIVLQSMALDGGPFNRAYVDFNKMAQSFKNIQSLGPDQEKVLTELKSANKAEEEFIAYFSSVMNQLRPTNTQPINYVDAFTKIQEMKQRQSEITVLLKSSIRVLSLDASNEPGQIMNQIIDLVTNQVNVFKNPVNVLYFDSLRKSYYEANLKGLDGVTKGCFQLEGINL